MFCPAHGTIPGRVLNGTREAPVAEAVVGRGRDSAEAGAGDASSVFLFNMAASDNFEVVFERRVQSPLDNYAFVTLGVDGPLAWHTCCGGIVCDSERGRGLFTGTPVLHET